MKKFKFTLQSLLNVKISIEKQYMAELGQCEQRLAAFQRELKAIIARLNHQKADYAQACKRGLKPSDLAVYSVGFKAVRYKISQQEEKIELAEAEKKRIQNKIVEVMGERKMLEKLKEKQLDEYRLLQKAEDAAIIDDFLSNKVDRQRSAAE